MNILNSKAVHPPSTTTEDLSKNDRYRFAWRLAALIFTRLCLNTARRFCYPFAPALARGMAVPLSSVASIVAITQLTAFFGMAIGPFADRHGYRFMMLAGLGCMCCGMMIGGMFHWIPTLFIALFLAGIGKAILDPVIQAYLGDQVPYHRRGVAIGISETAWAGSSLIGIPLIGFLMDIHGWQAPFWALAAGSIVSMLAIWRLIPTVHSRPALETESKQASFGEWLRLFQYRPSLGALGFGFLFSLGADNLFIVYGIWFESAFHLKVASLGLTAMVIGFAELTGEGFTALLSDRLGHLRALTIGGFLSAASYLLLPLTGRTLTPALAALFIVFVTFEFTMVTAFLVSTEILPEARATMMGGYYAAASGGRVLGGLLGIYFWNLGGIRMVAGFSCGVTLLGLALMRWGLRK